MDWLSFISTVIDSVAWPAAVIILVLLLRKPISNLIPLLQKLKYKDLELEFGRRIEEAKEEAATELPPEIDILALPSADRDNLAQLAAISPRAVVTEAWRKVETAALDAAERHAVALPYRHARSPVQVIRALQKAGLVGQGKMPLFEDLRVLRNEAAHAPEFALSPDSAIEYASLAHRFAQYLDSL